MIRLRLSFTVALLLCYSQAFAAEDQCLSCHKEIASPQAQTFLKDVHYLAGLTCASCHGGDPNATEMEAAMSPESGFKGVPRRNQIPELCGKCHGSESSPLKDSFGLGDVLTEFEEGIHGRTLKESIDGPQCVSCHGVHNILKVQDKDSPVHPVRIVRTCARCHSDTNYMKKFNPTVAVDQLEKYLTSVHGKKNASRDVRAATCVSCHSSHLIHPVRDPRSPVYPTNIPATCSRCHSSAAYMKGYQIPINQYEEYSKSVHGMALLKRSDLSAPACNSCHGNHGAVPPGVASVSMVCGVCHQANEDLFQKSIHKEAFEQAGLPSCMACHSNHLVVSPTDSMVGLDSKSNCGQCHSPTDTAAPTIRKMREVLDHLAMGQKEAAALLSHAEQLGMDVAEVKYTLKDANQSLIQSKVKVHSFDPAAVEETAKPGLAVLGKAKQSANEAIREYHFRRQGLGVSTSIITVLAVLLYLKIRQMEKRQKEKK